MIWAILALAFILRLVNLNQSLWLDEAAQVLMSQKTLTFIIFERSGDFHPPLSYILYHFWLMFGTSEIWLRILPIIFGVVMVFIIYKLSQKLFNEKIALISAILLATAPYHIYYSQEIRMYSMAAFLASLSMYFLLTSKKLGYILSTSALILTHYMGAFLLLAQIIYDRKVLKKLPFIILLFLPWLPFFWQQLKSGVNADSYLPGWGAVLNLEPVKAIPLTFLKFSIGRISFDEKYIYALIGVLILGLFGFLLAKSLTSKSQVRVIALWLFVPIILSWLISFFIPLYQPFRLLFVLPAFYILLAVGIAQLRGYWRFGVLGVIGIAISGLLIYWTNPKFQREDWMTATRKIPKNAIFAWPEAFDPYIWYGGIGEGVIKKFPANEHDVAQNLLNAKLSNQVYVFEYLQTLSDPNHYIQSWLEENGYKLEKTLNYNGVGFVDKFVR